MNCRNHFVKFCVRAALGACLKLSAASIACCLSIAAGWAQTPEQQQLWDAQRAQAQAEAKVRAAILAQQRAARKADPMAWVHTLDPIPAGGWEFRAVAPDGSWAAFSTDHQEKRSGKMITLWLRQEYPEAQRSDGGDVYLSNVEKVQFDCGNDRQRVLLVIYYSENNIAGSQQQMESDPKHAPWEAVVPGTQSDSVFQWACSKAHHP
jgi:hypothetical protein